MPDHAHATRVDAAQQRVAGQIRRSIVFGPPMHCQCVWQAPHQPAQHLLAAGADANVLLDGFNHGRVKLVKQELLQSRRIGATGSVRRVAREHGGTPGAASV